VRAGLTGNICRCSAYNRYVEATLAAASSVPKGGTAKYEAAAGAPLPVLQTAGHPTPRIDALERVTGKANYTGDVHVPGSCTRPCCAARTHTPGSAVSIP
jgi:xanthine dehydrogenase iron-sulfur cluster and FAD-binding subunit A